MNICHGTLLKSSCFVRTARDAKISVNTSLNPHIKYGIFRKAPFRLSVLELWGRCLIVLHTIAFSQRGGRFWSSSGVFPSSRVWNVHQDGSSCISADERLKREAVSMKWNRPTGHLHHNVYLTTTTRIDPSACSLTVPNIKWRFNVIDNRIEMTKIIF